MELESIKQDAVENGLLRVTQLDQNIAYIPTGSRAVSWNHKRLFTILTSDTLTESEILSNKNLGQVWRCHCRGAWPPPTQRTWWTSWCVWQQTLRQIWQESFLAGFGTTCRHRRILNRASCGRGHVRLRDVLSQHRNDPPKHYNSKTYLTTCDMVPSYMCV